MGRDSDSRCTGRLYHNEVVALEHFLENRGLTLWALGWALGNRPI